MIIKLCSRKNKLELLRDIAVGKSNLVQVKQFPFMMTLLAFKI